MRIDARNIPEAERKRKIIQYLKELNYGDNLTLLNSHDMSPLVKFIERELPGHYLYSYLINGPAEWELDIQRKPIESFSVEEIIGINPSSIFILHKYGIDFYSNYHVKLGNLFLNKKEDPSKILDEALHFKSDVFSFIRPEIWPPDLIIEFIVNNHHKFLYKRLPEINKMINHLEANMGSGSPKLQRLQERFTQFIEEMNDHLKEEETNIFPAIKKALSSRLSQEKKRSLILNELNWMKEEHFLTGDNLITIRKLCDNYLVDEFDMPGTKLVYEELKDVENDLLLHILFEDHFLRKSIEQLL